jgi:hypothetical protein
MIIILFHTCLFIILFYLKANLSQRGKISYDGGGKSTLFRIWIQSSHYLVQSAAVNHHDRPILIGWLLFKTVFNFLFYIKF